MLVQNNNIWPPQASMLAKIITCVLPEHSNSTSIHWPELPNSTINHASQDNTFVSVAMFCCRNQRDSSPCCAGTLRLASPEFFASTTAVSLGAVDRAGPLALSAVPCRSHCFHCHSRLAKHVCVCCALANQSELVVHAMGHLESHAACRPSNAFLVGRAVAAVCTDTICSGNIPTLSKFCKAYK